MPSKYTNEQFLEKAHLVHGNKYDYSKTNYIRSHDKIIIICKIHGEFLQKPNDHLCNHGCKLCGRCDKTMNAKTFIDEATKINPHYNYSECFYEHRNKYVNIICPDHGLFRTTPALILKGRKCAKCSHINQSMTISEFILRSNKIHNDKYDYSLVNYVNNYTPINILCNKHGIFSQIPSNHLDGADCIHCSLDNKKINYKDFINRANIIHHDKYDYQKVNFDNYLNNRFRITIKCKIHGEFEQSVFAHLINENGCRKCSSIVSKSETKWLDSLHLPNDKQHRNVVIYVNNRRFVVDGFIPKSNLIYEFLGDYWHGNPSVYDLKSINRCTKTTFQTLFDKTVERIAFLRKNNFKVISIWEKSFKKKK